MKIHNITEVIFLRWADRLDHDIYADDTRHVSRLEFQSRVAQRQSDLAPCLDPADRVMIRAGRGVDFFIDLFAVWGLRGVVVPVADDAAQSYLEHVWTISGAALCIGHAPYEPRKNFEGKTPCLGGDDLAALLFTSGSTGTPKGVMLSHAALLGNSLGTLKIIKIAAERLFVNAPFHFTSAICHFLACSLSGSTFVGIERKLFPADLLQTMASMEATFFGGAPIQLRWIAEVIQAAQASSKPIPLKLHGLISSGDHLPPEVVDSLARLLPRAKVFSIYGLTELAGRFCVLDPHDFPAHRGSVGRPIEGLEASILELDSDQPLPPGQIGEVVVNGTLLCAGYYNDPERTARLLTTAGMRTGDLGCMDADGFLYLQGRKDDVFKVNGVKVSAPVIAAAMLESGFFEDVAVLGRNVDHFGVVPVALYVMRKNLAFDRLRTLEFLRQRLPANHIPHKFVCLKGIPRTGSGKIIRNTLIELLEKQDERRSL